MLSLAPVDVRAEHRGGHLYLHSGHALAPPPATLGEVLESAAQRAPDRQFLVERTPTGDLREVSWREARAAAWRIAAHLLETVPPSAPAPGAAAPGPRPVLVLSGNRVDHALLTLGGYLAGVPIAPVSVAYSLASADHRKLRHIAAKLKPGLVYVEARAPFEAALQAVQEAVGEPLPVLTSEAEGPRTIGQWMCTEVDPAPVHHAAVGADSVAKILFTSGSTGFPKGVPNTHRMLTSNQQMIAQLWPFLAEEPPVLVDWLPWSHTFGGNHNLHLVLFHAGTLLVDEGKPTPALVDHTVANLRALPPTLYFNVPAGFAALVPRLERDPGLRDVFFSRLRLIFYAGAALPDDLWQRLSALAEASSGEPPFLTTAWGSTETSPMSTSAHFPQKRAGNIGVPAPGVSLKLVANGGKQEVRVAGPHVMAGYLDEPALTAAAFDDEGYYRIGDAVRLADPDDPAAGLIFDGRVAEDFKLSTGTWVNVGALRTELLAACSPVLQDLVVTGQDRDEIGILAWPSPAGCRGMVGEDAAGADLCAHPAVRAHLLQALAAWNQAHPQRSSRVGRLRLLAEPPSIDAGEITDKGYINQRVTKERRASDIARLYAGDPDVLFGP